MPVLTSENRRRCGSIHRRPLALGSHSLASPPRTGTIQIRAVFPNRDGGLLPGQFVRLNILGVTMPDAVQLDAMLTGERPVGDDVRMVEGGA